MIFVDANVLMYAVGRVHPLQGEARSFFEETTEGPGLCTSTEVLQELLHAYLPVGRFGALDAALILAKERIPLIFSVELEDVEKARTLAELHSSLGARDLLHLACCERRGLEQIKTFDRALRAAFRKLSRRA